MGFFNVYWDSTYYYLILVVPALLISLWAQIRVKSAFSRYSQVHNSRGLTGYLVARQILDDNGLQHVRIECVPGSLTDHFDPTKGVVRLSQAVYNSPSVAAIGVAAHECGHAIQYQHGYAPLKIRKAMVPITNIGSALSWPIALVGLFMGLPWLVNAGILLFVIVVVFQLITLPVEFNASRRALNIIQQRQMLAPGEEYQGARKMLTAAALTYVAALLVSIANLLRLLALANSRRR